MAVNADAASGLPYALWCTAVVVVGGAWFGEAFGTHRLPFHLVAILLVAAYVLRAPGRPAERLGRLGLRRPRGWNGPGLAVALALATVVVRLWAYDVSGAGGLALYQREFTRFLSAGPIAGPVVRPMAFALALFLATLVPGALFCGIIQEEFRRAGWFVTGLLVQSAAFGLVHCRTPGSLDLVYGLEAMIGGILYGLLFHWQGNLYVPSLLMSLHLFAVTVLLGVRQGTG